MVPVFICGHGLRELKNVSHRVMSTLVIVFLPLAPALSLQQQTGLSGPVCVLTVTIDAAGMPYDTTRPYTSCIGDWSGFKVFSFKEPSINVQKAYGADQRHLT